MESVRQIELFIIQNDNWYDVQSLQPIVENLQQEIKNKFQSNEKTKLDEASEFILANIFNKITEVELRDFETTKIETDMDCVEEDGAVVECTIVYYLTEL